MEEKTRLTPCACFYHDDAEGRLKIEIEMPGADKNNIKLDMRKDSFCLSAPRGENIEYSSCFMLSNEIEPEKAEAKFDSGLLKIFAPIKDWEHTVSVSVQ
jgi:HSP20 family molecular chaperone IbpA